MSLSQTTDPEKHRRDDFYGGADEYDDSIDDAKGHPDQRPSGTPKHRWVAKSVLKPGATYLDPIVLSDEPGDYDLYEEEDVGAAMVLTEPRHHVVADETREGLSGYAHQKRVNEELGHIVGGGTIRDYDVDGFLRRVDNWIQFLRESRSGSDALLDSDLELLRDRAEWLKRHDEENMHDTEIVEELSRAVDHPNGVADYFEEA